MRVVYSTRILPLPSGKNYGESMRPGCPVTWVFRDTAWLTDIDSAGEIAAS